MKTLLFVIALVLTANSLSLTKSQHMKVLAQVNTHPLGQAIFAQISIHMSSGEDYLKTVVAMVDDLVGGLNEQAAAALAAHKEQQAFCNKQRPAYESQIAAANRAAKQADETVAQTQELLAETEKLLATTLQELADINARIQAGQNQRDAEHAAWSALDGQHASGISACAQAVALINSLKRGALFIQLQGRINAVAKRLEDMTHLNDKFTAYAPLINSFAQIASSSGNQQLLDQITKLLNTLKGQISETQAADASWEQRKAAQWQKELTDLTAQRDALIARRNAQQAQISSQKDIIAQNKEDAANARDTAMRTTILLEELNKTCAAEQKAYDSAKKARDEELSILGKIRDYITSRMGVAEEFIMMQLMKN